MNKKDIVELYKKLIKNEKEFDGLDKYLKNQMEDGRLQATMERHLAAEKVERNKTKRNYKRSTMVNGKNKIPRPYNTRYSKKHMGMEKPSKDARR